MTSAERFFTSSLPRLIVGALPAFGVLRGVLAFACDGHAWTVRLGDLERPVEPGFDAGADVKLWFQAEAFERFLAGAAPGPGELQVQGSAEVLERFGRLLSGGGNALAVRLAR